MKRKKFTQTLMKRKMKVKLRRRNLNLENLSEGLREDFQDRCLLQKLEEKEMLLLEL